MKTEVLLQQVREAIAEIDCNLNQGTFDEVGEGYPTRTELMVIRDELK